VVRQHKPTIYQVIDGTRRDVEGGYVIKGKRSVAFRVSPYDRTRPLVIDPVLFYSTYLGGSNSDVGGGIAVDAAGNAYVSGNTASTNFPTTSGAFRTTNSGDLDAFVAKLNSTGSALVYSTYLGGGGEDSASSIAVDAAGNAYALRLLFRGRRFEEQESSETERTTRTTAHQWRRSKDLSQQ